MGFKDRLFRALHLQLFGGHLKYHATLSPCILIFPLLGLRL